MISSSDARDRTLLLFGFAGALQRDELRSAVPLL
jgi:hypothetical protein